MSSISESNRYIVRSPGVKSGNARVEGARISIPAPAREAIQKAVGSAKLLLVETVSEKGSTFYQAHFKKGGQESEVKVDAAGKPVL